MPDTIDYPYATERNTVQVCSTRSMNNVSRLDPEDRRRNMNLIVELASGVAPFDVQLQVS